MNKNSVSIWQRIAFSLVSILAIFFSVLVFLIEFNYSVRYQFVLGAFGSILGAFIAYLLVRIKMLMDSPVIFISYTSSDFEFAHKIAHELQKTTMRVLIDYNELQVGDNITEKLNKLIEDCDYFAPILSSESVKSEWVSKELDQALASKKKILPLLKDRIDPPDSIKGIIYADFTNSFDAGFEKLRMALKGNRNNRKIKPIS